MRNDMSDDDLLRELNEVRAENARLRELLGLDSRRAESHAQSWEPSLFQDTPGLARVDSGSSAEEKLALYQQLFAGRADVFALRWQNDTNGRSGWSPAIRGGWSKASKARRDYLPLTDEVLAAHLEGRSTVGLYPLLHGDACSLLVCDFDGTTWALDALAYLDACIDAGVPAALERSRSGDGAHVWIFFTATVPAATARSLGAALLREAMTARGELDLASYDRFFPAQDFMPKGSFGNLIALPLQGDRARRGTTVFLDPTSLEPWPDQWAFLSSVKRSTPAALATLVNALRPIDAGPDARSLRVGPGGGGPAPPTVIRARLFGTLAIERGGLPPALLASLKHLASLHNPVFYEKQRMRFSTWATPRFIRCYHEDLEWLHLPRGLVGQTGELVSQAGSRLDITDARPVPAPVDFRFEGELTAVQRAAVDALAPHDHGVLVAPPGAGKTVMACALIARHATPTLVIVDRRPLLDQWRSRLGTLLGLDTTKVGQIGGDRTRPSGLVDVAMIQSLARHDDPNNAFSGYGLVVVDECHHLPAVSFETAVKRAPVRRWLGLTATPYRRDGLEAIIAMQCGPTRHEIPVDTHRGSGGLRLNLIVHNTISDLAPSDDIGIQDVFRAVVEDRQRTFEICTDVAAASGAGRNCLVLTQRTDHIDRIVTELRAHGCSPLELRGGTGKRALARVVDKLAAARDGGVVLVATGSYLGEGFDWPALDTLFLAFPIAFKGRVVQYVGRLLRAHEGKDRVELHDYVDELIPVLARMHKKRLAAYSTLGFNIAKPV
jgi:superfamily II DNA or RNA helicase